jgi:sugar lactone lactonase YvrE
VQSELSEKLDCELIASIDVQNTVGEGVIWNHQTVSAWWTDIQGERVYQYQLSNQLLQSWPAPERLGSFAFVENDTRLLCAFASGFAYFCPQTGEVEWLWRPEQENPGNRFNDGRVDRQGRFWAGTMVENPAQSSAPAALYCLHTQARALSALTISNGLCWSPDSRKLYHADSPRRQISVYDFDAETATLSNRRPFAQTEKNIFPDGASVDSQGYLWSAHWGGWRIVRYAPDGSVDAILPVPLSQPSCVAFGGENLNLLLVTSARENLSAEQLARESQAGNLLIYRTAFRGLPETFARPV